jgi:hypothetical protein
VGVKVVGAADSIAPAPTVQVAEDIGSGNAHDNSHGGVDVINKHDDKVRVISSPAAVEKTRENIHLNYIPRSTS